MFPLSINCHAINNQIINKWYGLFSKYGFIRFIRSPTWIAELQSGSISLYRGETV